MIIHRIHVCCLKSESDSSVYIEKKADLPEVTMESLRPLNKANFADVLDYGIFLFKKHFKKIFLLNLMLNIPFLLILAALSPTIANDYKLVLNPEAIESNPTAIFSSILSLYATLFLFLAVYGIHGITLNNIMEGSIVKIIYSDVILGESRTIKQVVKECFGQFGSMLLGRILYNLIQGAVFIGVYIAVAAGMFIISIAATVVFTAGAVSPWITVVLTVIGVLAAIVLLFFIGLTIYYFMGKYWMFLPAICIEQKKAGESVERCNRIGQSSFYLTGLTYLFIYLIVYLLPGTINSIAALVSVLTGNMDVSVLAVGSIITQLVSSMLQPLITCVLTALYITLRVKREGLDLEIDLWKIKMEEASKARRWTAEAQI